MRGRPFDFRICLLVGLTIALPVPASASQAAFEKAWVTCGDMQAAASTRIASCDAIIASTQFKGGQRAQALTNRGIFRALQKNFAGAIADFDAALRETPDNARLYYLRGLTWDQTNDADKARADLDTALSLSPNNLLIYRARGINATTRKDFKQAIADLTTAISLSKEPKREIALRGIAYEEDGQRAAAIADFQKALEIDPDDQPLRKHLATLGGATPKAAALPPGKCSGEKVSNEERLAGCTAVIDSGKVTGFALKAAYCNRGYALTELKQYDRVIADAEAAMKIDDKDPCPYLNRGRAYYFKQDLDSAIADYTQAIKLDPTYHEAFANRGAALHLRREFARAVPDYDAAIALRPDIADYFVDRANTLHYMKEFDRAAADLTRAMAINGPQPELLQRRGDYYLASGAIDNAIDDYTKAIKLAPTEQRFLHARAAAYDAKNDTAHAQADRDAAKEVERKNFQTKFLRPITDKAARMEKQ